ncbi:MAG TPA: PBP1A family penicillin-binding protein [Gemmatimonadaceae bacterium]|nr:PBP1A family penicillin-binding protein [Gemmatimonadaceae bacterium]
MNFARTRLERLRARWRRNPADPPRLWMRRQWKWLVAMTLVLLAVGSFDVWIGTCGFHGCPSDAEIRRFAPSEGGRVLDRNGRLIGRLAVVRRVNVPLSAVPTYVQAAFIATEDRRFYEHDGIDWRSFMRALARNVREGGIREGASTITMQVAHNSFLQKRYHGRSPLRKLVELRISRLLEKELTKDQILEHYLNVIYMGNGVNGVEAASRDLFGKSIGKVTLAEAALLAALPKAPSRYTPRASRDRAIARRNLVLTLMSEQRFVSPGVADRAKAERLRIAAEEWRPSLADEPSAIDAVRAVVDSVFPDILKDGDVTVETTLDYTLQRAADKVVVRQAIAITRETQASYGRTPEVAQGAFVAMDPHSGDIRAMVTGRRTQRGQFNHAVSAKRQPGSAFKPFVYAAAISAGYAPSTLVDDEPIEVDMGRTVWIPANYNDEYRGTVTMRQALIASANAATVIISQKVGAQRVIATAHNNGITSPLQPVPSIALGALEVTPLELVTAYAPFGNGGYRVKPRLVTRIIAPDGKVLREFESLRTPAMNPQDAYEMTSMLRGVVDYGTGRAVRDAGIRVPIAGKTGTTNNGADVWFVAYSPTLVAGVWFGYDTPRPISHNAAGGRLAAPAWAEIFRTGWREPKGSNWDVPPGMVPAVFDPETGQIATEWCPQRVREYFKPGSTPQETCQLHNEWTNRIITEDVEGPTRSEDRRRQSEVDKIFDGLKKGLGRIFGRGH